MKMTGNWLRSSVVVITAGAGIFSSCSPKVAAPPSATASRQDTTLQIAQRVFKAVPVDTVVTPLKQRSSSVESFWRSEIIAKSESLYRASAYQTLWFFDNGPSPLFETAISMLKDAGTHGLDPAAYADADLELRVRELYSHDPDAKQIAELDIYFTDKFLLFTTHVADGRVVSVANGKSVWKRATAGSSAKDVEILSNVNSPEQLRAAIKRIQPQHEQYVRLQHALAFYRTIEQFSTQPISIPSSIKPGETSIAVPLLRKKLAYLNGAHSLRDSLKSDTLNTVIAGQSIGKPADSLLYDADLVAAVQLFQRRHGLTADGVIGERTLRFMNLSVTERIAQIALNMERLRWTPAINSERYLLVNIPDYKLTVYEGANRAFDMRVIVGSSTTPTPVFNDQLNHIVFSPTWTVPTSIIKNEIIPNLRKDSTHYSEKNFVIYKQDVQIDPALENWKDPNINPYQLRVVQNPGADNSLGSVKFMMPNNMSVYLHDTPSRRLFTKDYRALSHGCVRLHEPAKLAEYLLKDQHGWDTARIAKAMSGSSPATIILKKRYPVYLVYQTAWVDDEGLLQFREDIYGHDKAQIRQLHTAKPVATSVAVSAAGK